MVLSMLVALTECGNKLCTGQLKKKFDPFRLNQINKEC